MNNFDRFLDKAKFYGKIFLAGFLSGLVGYLIKIFIESRAFTIDFIFHPQFYLYGVTVGMIVLLTGIVDDFLQQISFMKSFYQKMEPVYYSILGPVLLAVVLAFTVPISNIVLHSKVFKLALKHFTIPNFFRALFAGYQLKFKSLFVYFMIRVTIDSISTVIYRKYLESGNKNVRIFIFTLVAGVSAAVSALISYEISNSFKVFSGILLAIVIHDALIMMAITAVALIITEQFKIIAFVDALC